MTSNPRRSTLRAWIHYGSLAVIVLSVFAVMAQLPVREVMDRLHGALEGMGAWGRVTFGMVYVLATILLVPGSAITLAAGLIFGLGWGTVTASLASTAGAAAAFLIGRYLARERVARLAQQNPRLKAVDRAVSRGGWKIVGLLRLSPAVPFNLQNYLYGLTGIRFWPCILTSWVAMLPGTFMYVYLGYLARAGVETAAEGGAADAGMWALRIIGLVATVAVTVYVTRLARGALREQMEIKESPEPPPEEAAPTEPAPAGWKGAVAPALALILAAVAVYAVAHPEVIREPVRQALSILGPPAVVTPF